MDDENDENGENEDMVKTQTEKGIQVTQSVPDDKETAQNKDKTNGLQLYNKNEKIDFSKIGYFLEPPNGKISQNERKLVRVINLRPNQDVKKSVIGISTLNFRTKPPIRAKMSMTDYLMKTHPIQNGSTQNNKIIIDDDKPTRMIHQRQSDEEINQEFELFAGEKNNNYSFNHLRKS